MEMSLTNIMIIPVVPSSMYLIGRKLLIKLVLHWMIIRHSPGGVHLGSILIPMLEDETQKYPYNKEAIVPPKTRRSFPTPLKQ